MYGHQTPCRMSAWPHRLLMRQHPLRPIPSFPILALVALAVMFAGTLFAAGCGSSGSGETTTTVAPAVSTTVAAVSTTATTAAVTSSTLPRLAEGTFPVTVTDDNKASVTVGAKPLRIVSTAPANTEMLFALGLGDQVVGVNSLDNYPPEVADIAKVGDFQLNTEAVIALSPDLVVAYSGNEEAVGPLQKAGTPVLIFNPTTVEQIYVDLTTLGAATGATGKAAELVDSIKAQIKEISDAAAAAGDSPKVFYALDNTLWTSGPGSFVDELLTLAHATNVAASPGAGGAAAQAYYQFAPEQLVAADPDVILLPGSIYKSAAEFTGDPRFAGLKAVKEGRVLVIDDVIVTRPGPRIAEGLKILAAAIHPAAF
jgi:iron complex transport system substrate-binding protein